MARWLVVGLIAASCASRCAIADDLSLEDREFFESKVRPILVARCYECHSGESPTLRGGLRVDYRGGLIEGGDTGPAIDLENRVESLLLTAIGYDDAVLKMPPKGKLPEAEITVLVDWVKRGAPDPRDEMPAASARKAERVIDIAAGRQHWAFQPLREAALPAVKNEAWCKTPIDRFILARLEAEGIEPSARAESRVLLRRAYFDLTGLPPTADEVDAFAGDVGDEAFPAVVERLLESPRYGERWARHWLDLARWAESHGFEHDYDRPTAYHYRDFVIEALNRDLPYDTFVKWQLAGDEYAPEDHLALKATGFLGAGTHSTQITANQVEKERYDELDDMLNTAGTAFLGLTLGCARCHDHKYDPIPTRDYYRMLATFTTTVRTEVDLKPDDEAYDEALRRYERDHRRYEELRERFEEKDLPSRFARWEREQSEQSSEGPAWTVLQLSKVESAGGAKARALGDGSWLFEGPNAEFDTYTVMAACDLAEITAVRVEALADDSLVARGPGRAGNGNFALTDVKVKVGPRFGIGASVEPKLVNAKATFEQAGLPVAAAIDDDPKSGWAVDPEFGRDHAAVFEFASDVRTDSGCTLTLTLTFQNNQGHNIGRLRVSATDAKRPVGIDGNGVPAGVRALLGVAAEERTDAQCAALLEWYKTIDPAWRALQQDVEIHEKAKPTREGVKALICSEGLPPLRLHSQGADFLDQTHLLRRGDPTQKVEVVDQGFLQVLMDDGAREAKWQTPAPEGVKTSYRRRALAEWMTDTESGAGQLLARVIVNRVWQHHFGRGLVATPSDFGAQGAPPTHPELLDWLAQRLIDNGWRLKPLHKLIMASASYQQGSGLDPRRAAVDPENALHWRQNRRRLEAEAIRDSMLFVSGLLDERMYGPGTLDERSRRRSVYFTIKRSRLIPMLTLFDAPDGLVPIAARSSTTVAPQALYLLNSPVAREWASGLAGRVLEGTEPGQGADAIERVRQAYRYALGRWPTSDEERQACAFLEGDEGAADERLVDFCQVLLSTNEFVHSE